MSKAPPGAREAANAVTVSRAGLEVRVFRAPGPVITLVHGGLVGQWGWQFQLPALVRPNLLRAGSLLCYDQRGYGENAAATGDGGLAALSRDLVTIWEELEIERTIVVGFSLGGFVALDAAAAAPNRVAAIVLEGCAEPTPAVRKSFERRADELLAGDHDAAIAEHVRNAFSQRFVDEQPEVLAEYTGVAQAAPVDALADCFRDIAGWSLSAAQAELEVPARLICGEHDQAFGPTQSREFAAKLRDAEAVCIPRTGHTAHLENSAAFNHLVLDFVDTKGSDA